MAAFSISNSITNPIFFSPPSSSSPKSHHHHRAFYASLFRKTPSCLRTLSPLISARRSSRRWRSETLATSSSSSSETAEEWLKKLPEKKKPLYSHSLPCIEAWLESLGFYQSREDQAVWVVEKPEWHAQLSLDVVDLYIRYLKSGPGNLEKDVERRFSYALSREDIENAILGGP